MQAAGHFNQLDQCLSGCIRRLASDQSLDVDINPYSTAQCLIPRWVQTSTAQRVCHVENTHSEDDLFTASR